MERRISPRAGILAWALSLDKVRANELLVNSHEILPIMAAQREAFQEQSNPLSLWIKEEIVAGRRGCLHRFRSREQP